MRYENSSAFRRALEDRLRNQSIETGVPLIRLRKMVTFDRFLARLLVNYPNTWLLKGGLALQLRLANRARTTKDIDILILEAGIDIFTILRSAGAFDLGDWFHFDVVRPLLDQTVKELGGQRFHVRATLDSRIFEDFHLDIGVGNPVIEPIEYIEGSGLLIFAEILPIQIPCFPISQQIAEKVHAYTRPHRSGENSRAKDFLDILLLAQIEQIIGNRFEEALVATFRVSGTHPIPNLLPQPPKEWRQYYNDFSKLTGLHFYSFEEAINALEIIINPILSGNVRGQIWFPKEWMWK